MLMKEFKRKTGARIAFNAYDISYIEALDNGVNTMISVANGEHVVVVDPFQEVLSKLSQRAPFSARKKFKTKPKGNFHGQSRDWRNAKPQGNSGVHGVS